MELCASGWWMERKSSADPAPQPGRLAGRYRLHPAADHRTDGRQREIHHCVENLRRLPLILWTV